MNLKLSIARAKLWYAEDILNCAKERTDKTDRLLQHYKLQLKDAQENYDKAFKIWWDTGVSKKEP